MTTFLTDAEIAPAIRAITPTHVAVAYLGADWSRFLPDLQQLRQVIVAPVLGTNPYAVEDLLQAYRQAGIDPWSRVFFLDNLHAKLYLGQQAAVFGSANLSMNGLSGEGLKELSAVTHEAADLARLQAYFADVLELAKAQYGTPAAKKQRLAKLLQDVARNPAFAGGHVPRKPLAFEDFELLAPDQFYVSWYRNVDSVEYTDDNVASFIKDFLLLSPKDDVQENKWVLCWQCDGDQRPLAKAYWFMIDAVVPNGVKRVDGDETPYTTLAIERESANSRHRKLQVPFELTRPVSRALFAALQDEALWKRLTSDKLTVTQKALPDLVDRMRRAMSAS